jgi:RNA polymerase sigma-70 factor (sigma-E family)
VTADRDREFTEYVTSRLGSLRRLSYLLCQDPGHVDDLVQIAITRLYTHWARASAAENTDAYVRTILVREFLGEQRSGWARRVSLDAAVPDLPVVEPDLAAALDIRAALAGLPPRQRATVVLRFYCDLNVDQAARVLGCSTGTVKSQTAKGLDALRRALGPEEAAPGGPQPELPRGTRSSHQEVADHG